jgi:hypothetical protein
MCMVSFEKFANNRILIHFADPKPAIWISVDVRLCSIVTFTLGNVGLYLAFGLFSKCMAYALTSGFRSRLGYTGPSIIDVAATRYIK